VSDFPQPEEPRRQPDPEMAVEARAEPSAAVYHSHGESILRHLTRASRDVPTVVGNFLHLGSGGRFEPSAPKAEPVTGPAPD